MMEKVELKLGNDYKIRIKSNHDTYLKDIIEKFSIHVPNYYFMPKYRAGVWNGKQNFITAAGMMPYGLLLDFIRVHKELYPELPIEADDNIKSLFKGEDLDIDYNLKFTPRPYQKEAIEICLKYKKGIIRAATASGKSLTISYIIKILLNNRSKTNVDKALIIVPSKSLVEQFKSDMVDYGLSENHIGKVYSKFKEWDKIILISTWQTLKNNLDKLKLYDCIIGDECHQVKAYELKKIFSKSKAEYRFGFTGTLPTPLTELYSIKSFIGNVLKEYPSGLLADQGYISKCTVKIIKLDYPKGTEANTYHEIKEEVFNDKKRLDIIANVVNSIENENILLLVNQLDEGDRLMKLLNRRTKRTTVFLSGKDDTEIREKWRKKMLKEDNIAIIATFGIMSTGVNIPNLKHLMLASPTKSKIRTLQSIGRALRLHESKTEGAFIYDIVDDVKYLYRHADQRMDYYKNEGHNIKYFERKDFIL